MTMTATMRPTVERFERGFSSLTIGPKYATRLISILASVATSNVAHGASVLRESHAPTPLVDRRVP
jgi:hypothetical protein